MCGNRDQAHPTLSLAKPRSRHPEMRSLAGCQRDRTGDSTCAGRVQGHVKNNRKPLGNRPGDQVPDPREIVVPGSWGLGPPGQQRAKMPLQLFFWVDLLGTATVLNLLFGFFSPVDAGKTGGPGMGVCCACAGHPVQRVLGALDLAPCEDTTLDEGRIRCLAAGGFRHQRHVQGCTCEFAGFVPWRSVEQKNHLYPGCKNEPLCLFQRLTRHSRGWRC